MKGVLKERQIPHRHSTRSFFFLFFPPVFSLHTPQNSILPFSDGSNIFLPRYCPNFRFRDWEHEKEKKRNWGGVHNVCVFCFAFLIDRLIDWKKKNEIRSRAKKNENSANFLFLSKAKILSA